MRFLKDGETPQFVVCSAVSYFPDDQFTPCAGCKRTVYHRPHTPIPLIGYICGECTSLKMKFEEAPQIVTTPRAVEEAKDEINRRKRLQGRNWDLW